MLLQFTKMHGLGNDFMVVDMVSQKYHFLQNKIPELADRHFGVGFDQLLLVEPPTNPDMDFRYRIFNADGSEVEQCGNGARCFALFVREKRLIMRDFIKVQTAGGNLELHILPDNQVKVNMGFPRLDPVEIPFLADKKAARYLIDIEDKPVEISAVSMGNPHAVVLVEKTHYADVDFWGARIQKHESFPNLCNVGFMEILGSNEINLRVYERGVGETLACGSGACAAAVAGIIADILDNNITVNLSGGTLYIEWAGEGCAVTMTGKATTVYEGYIHI